MEANTFYELLNRLTDEQLNWLHNNGLFTDDFAFAIETEMYKRCLI